MPPANRTTARTRSELLVDCISRSNQILFYCFLSVIRLANEQCMEPKLVVPEGMLRSNVWRHGSQHAKGHVKNRTRFSTCPLARRASFRAESEIRQTADAVLQQMLCAPCCRSLVNRDRRKITLSSRTRKTTSAIRLRVRFAHAAH